MRVSCKWEGTAPWHDVQIAEPCRTSDDESLIYRVDLDCQLRQALPNYSPSLARACHELAILFYTFFFLFRLSLQNTTMFSYTFFIAVTLVATAAAQVQFLGVAIAGGDFGCQIDGSCPTGSTQLPLGSNGGGGDGPGQMQHWASLDKPLNLFRLPVSWQFLANNQLGGDLDSNNLAKYDQLVQACLGTGAHCMIDIHNFARWNGGIIGQGGPTDDQFVALWTQLATKYAGEDRMVFELMNEPHDLDINVWAATCQKVVAAIRGAGASSQMILLPGTNFDSAATLVSSGSTAALMNITNPDGTTDNLLLDIHKYLDEDNSGTHKTCTTDNVDAFSTVADFLRTAGRKGIVSETGASSDSTVSAPFFYNLCT